MHCQRITRRNFCSLSLQKEFGSVHALLASPSSRCSVRNVGPAKAARLKAINELGVRETEIQLKRKQCFNKPVAVARFPRKRLGHLGYEVFGFLFLNAKYEHIALEILFRGSIDRTHLHTPAKC